MKKSVLFLLLALTIPPCFVLLSLTDKLKTAAKERIENVPPPQIDPKPIQQGY